MILVPSTNEVPLLLFRLVAVVEILRALAAVAPVAISFIISVLLVLFPENIGRTFGTHATLRAQKVVASLLA